jgi:hypothetical protein
MLISTRPIGLYDLWVTRDECGTPLRYDWPYFRDDDSVKRLISQRPVKVSTCWNADSVEEMVLPPSPHKVDAGKSKAQLASSTEDGTYPRFLPLDSIPSGQLSSFATSRTCVGFPYIRSSRRVYAFRMLSLWLRHTPTISDPRTTPENSH